MPLSRVSPREPIVRLNGVILTTIPLRDRPEDIEPLVAVFTAEICKANKLSSYFQRGCIEILNKHRCKGNVRELRSAVESQLFRAEEDVVLPEHPQLTSMNRISQHRL